MKKTRTVHSPRPELTPAQIFFLLRGELAPSTSRWAKGNFDVHLMKRDPAAAENFRRENADRVEEYWNRYPEIGDEESVPDAIERKGREWLDYQRTFRKEA